jgi:peptidyl-prolyl cis-trans isomerase A (cyclophilin A)
MYAIGAILLASAGLTAQTSPLAKTAKLRNPAALNEQAPAKYNADFDTTKGKFTITVTRAWAPLGADRFYNLVKNGFYDGAKFFRVVPPFVVQFGISPYPDVSKKWRGETIPDDPVTNHNVRGAVSFASAGANTRTTQMFINLGDNRALDNNGFAPIGTVTSGMDVVDSLYSGYADQPTSHQREMETEGNSWLDKQYPKLDSIETAKVTHESNPALP